MESKKSVYEVKLGAPVTCPKCGGTNPSGTQVPSNCRWCIQPEISIKNLLNDKRERC